MTASAQATVPSPFGGANGREPTSKVPFFPPGFSGNLTVDKCLYMVTRAGDRAFIAEFQVESSNMAEIPVGSKRSWYQSLKEEATGWDSCILFLYACLGLDKNRDATVIQEKVKPVQGKLLDGAISDKNSLGGKKVSVETVAIKTKKGMDFTKHIWAPHRAPAPSGQQIA